MSNQFPELKSRNSKYGTNSCTYKYLPSQSEIHLESILGQPCSHVTKWLKIAIKYQNWTIALPFSLLILQLFHISFFLLLTRQQKLQFVFSKKILPPMQKVAAHYRQDRFCLFVNFCLNVLFFSLMYSELPDDIYNFVAQIQLIYVITLIYDVIMPSLQCYV